MRYTYSRLLQRLKSNSLCEVTISIYCMEAIKLLMSCGVVIYEKHIEDILPKGPYLPCLRMADSALLAGYPRYVAPLALHMRVSTCIIAWEVSVPWAYRFWGVFQIGVNKPVIVPVTRARAVCYIYWSGKNIWYRIIIYSICIIKHLTKRLIHFFRKWKVVTDEIIWRP